ncbi:oligosaccharide flippase family protein [bacterium]|nr:oligosaccharide flippase family protein [bacterium]
MEKSNNKLVKHTSIYMFGDILRRSVSLIMLPIYTRYLTPEDYGVVELLSMLIDFATIIFGAQVGQAIFRYYCTAKSDDEKKSIVSSSLFLSGLMNMIGVTVVMFFSDQLSIAIFSDDSYSTFITLFAITMLLEPFMLIPLTQIRAEQKPWLFLIFSLMKLVIQLSLNIYFVVIQEMHVEGVIYSAIISASIMSVILVIYSISKTGILIKFETCKSLFSFGLPLKLANIGSFYLAFGDRYFINIFTDLAQVGIYSLGYKFGFIFLILSWDPFQKMWDSEKYAIYKKDNAVEIYQNIFLYISSFLILTGLCISLFTKDLLTIMSDPAFLSAHEIVPIIIIAYILQAWTSYCNFGILLEGKTIKIAHAEIIGVILITIAYLTLIPLYGIHGAAWATVIGFAARFYWTNKKGKENYDMKLPWKKVGLIFSLATIILLVSFNSPDEIILSIVTRLGLVLLFIAIFFALPILSKQEKQFAWKKIIELKQNKLNRQ